MGTIRKKALITGGTRGIGFAIAELLVQEGHEVFVTGRGSADGGSASAGPQGTRYLVCDFSDKKATLDFAQRVAGEKFDILVNNAGINKVGPVSDYDLEDFEKIQQVNVTAPFLMCKAVVPEMCRRKFGRIVNITSILGVVSRSGRSAYSASKCGLLGLSRALALEVAKENVLVNCLAPGFVDTDLTRKILGEIGVKEVTEKIPVGRMGRPEEIAGWVQFLVSEKNSYMTGQTLIVDGGFTCE